MKQFNQLSPQAQTTIIRTLLSCYSGDLPQHVKDEIAEWKIYSTSVRPQQTAPNGSIVTLPDNHRLRMTIDFYTVDGGKARSVHDFAGLTVGEVKAKYPNLTYIFYCEDYNLPTQQVISELGNKSGLSWHLLNDETTTVIGRKELEELTKMALGNKGINSASTH